MSSINNISDVSNIAYLQPTTGATQSVGGSDSDGDNDGSGGAGKVGKSNFLSIIEQALNQSLSGSSATSSSSSSTSGAASTNSTQDPQAAVLSFMHNLFAALHQTSGTSAGNGSDADGDNDGSSSTSGVGSGQNRRSHLEANIQNLLQQLSAGTQSTTATGQSSSGADPLGNLTSSFQNLVDTLNAQQGQSTSAANPNLQSFLQNLLQNVSGGQNISGAVVSTNA